MHKKSKILIFGSNGLIGAAIVCYLKNKGFSSIITDHLSGEKLTSAKSVSLLFRDNRPEYCFLASPREGGIAANITYPAELIYDNLSIQTNVIHSAYSFGVKKLIFIASSCVYPKNSPQPLKEEYLLTGTFEPTN